MCPRETHKRLSFQFLVSSSPASTRCGEQKFQVPSETDYIIRFVKTTCTDKGHPWSISESQHLYTMLNPVMIVCENPLSVRPSPYISADLCSRAVIYQYMTQSVGWKTDITLF